MALTSGHAQDRPRPIFWRQDSNNCLAPALKSYERVKIIGFDYRQRDHVELEACLRALAETCVDRISVGALIKDVQAVDFSMRFQDRPVER